MALRASCDTAATAWREFSKTRRGVTRIDNAEFKRFCGAVGYLRQQLAGTLPIPTKMPINWLASDMLRGAELSPIAGKDIGLVATEHLPITHVVADIVIPSAGITCHKRDTVDSRTDILANWYGFGCDEYEVVPSQVTDELTGMITIEAVPLFACNEPSIDKTINCKVIVITADDATPVAIRLYTIAAVALGEELTLFYGTDRQDTSYPRNTLEWNVDNDNGFRLLDETLYGLVVA